MSGLKPERSMIAAYLIWFFLGGFGVHRMYLGRVKTGFLMFGMIVLVLGLFLIIGLADQAGRMNEIGLIVVSIVSIGTLLIWAIWYLVDVVLVAVMINKDRKHNAAMSPDAMETVFR